MNTLAQTLIALPTSGHPSPLRDTPFKDEELREQSLYRVVLPRPVVTSHSEAEPMYDWSNGDRVGDNIHSHVRCVEKILCIIGQMGTEWVITYIPMSSRVAGPWGASMERLPPHFPLLRSPPSGQHGPSWGQSHPRLRPQRDARPRSSLVQDLVQKYQSCRHATVWSTCNPRQTRRRRTNSPNSHMSCRNEELVVRGARVTPTWDGRVARLELDNLQQEDAGVYTCVAENELGRTRCSAELRVLDTLDPSDEDRRPPEFVQGLPETTVVLEGHSVELQVWLRGTPPLDVVWVKDDLEVPDCQDFRYVDRGDGRVALRLTDVFPQDAGQYRCEAFNDHGDATTATRLTVQEGSSSEASLSRRGPATTHLQFDKRPGPVLARIGGKASFCARVACADVVWSVAGASVTESSRFKSQLPIYPLTPQSLSISPQSLTISPQSLSIPLTPQSLSISPHPSVSQYTPHPSVSQYIPSPLNVSVYPLAPQPLSISPHPSVSQYIPTSLNLSVYLLAPQCLSNPLAPQSLSISPHPSVSQNIPSLLRLSVYPLTPQCFSIPPRPSVSQYIPSPLSVSVYPLAPQFLSISPHHSVSQYIPSPLSVSVYPLAPQCLSISPQPSVSQYIPSPLSLSVERQDDASILHIDPVSARDAGEVTCTATATTQGQDDASVSVTCSTELGVMEEDWGDAATASDGETNRSWSASPPPATTGDDGGTPAMLLRGPADTTALVGDRVVLKATYVGRPSPSVRWLRASNGFQPVIQFDPNFGPWDHHDILITTHGYTNLITAVR
uniref:Ig-like domain-containing protein n=1 Tax=Timema bartmani TaxID=61472 RepID=A0A7R9ETJ2_9NEOP|nr:unnamed protein product [Timema bartmani]